MDNNGALLFSSNVLLYDQKVKTMAAKEKMRIVFTFDEQSLVGLEEIKDDGNYSCFAETVRDSLQITRNHCARPGN